MYKICHVCSCFPPSYGGVETFVYNLCKKLIEKGYYIKVITSSRGKKPGRYYEWIDGIEVIRYPERIYLFETPLTPRIALHILFEDYDVLHIHGMVPILTDLALLIGKIRRKPIVLTYHYDAETLKYGVLGMIISRIYNHITISFVKLADKVVATTRSYAETSHVLSKILRRTVIIPCGIDINYFLNTQNNVQPSINAKYKILYVGKLIYYKGVDTLIKAFKIVTDALDDAYLIIVGNGEIEKLKLLAGKLGVNNKIMFTGWLPNELLPRYYHTSDIVVLPSIKSRREAFGIVLLEAMACRKPVIVSNIPGPRSIIKDGENGLLVPPGNSLKLADAIIKLLTNKKLKENMVRHAYETVKEYDWDNIVRQYEDIYKALVRFK